MNELQKRIEEEASNRYPLSQYNSSEIFIKGANFALEMDRWVKVGEQTPKDYERVLASNGIYQVVCEYKHGCFFMGLDQVTDAYAWHPLPKLPQ